MKNQPKKVRKNRRPLAKTYLSVAISPGSRRGHLVNMSRSGALIFTDHPIEATVEHSYTLEILLPEGDRGTKNIAVAGKCIWSLPQAHPNVFAAGFQLAGGDDHTRSRWHGLVREYGLADSTTPSDVAGRAVASGR